MTSDGRSHRRELVDEAYNLQVRAGLIVRSDQPSPLPSTQTPRSFLSLVDLNHP
jgi:hypothetical protein